MGIVVLGKKSYRLKSQYGLRVQRGKLQRVGQSSKDQESRREGRKKGRKKDEESRRKGRKKGRKVVRVWSRLLIICPVNSSGLLIIWKTPLF